MTIWTALFMVVSAVILASPLLLSSGALREDAGNEVGEGNMPEWEKEALELDLVSGRLARMDFEAMTGGRSEIQLGESAGRLRDDGNLSEG